MAPIRVQSWRLRLSINRKVGRAVLCAPPTATPLAFSAKQIRDSLPRLLPAAEQPTSYNYASGAAQTLPRAVYSIRN
jgi:hypothetical protein